MNLTAIQSALCDAKVDGWLFYDHHHRDPIAYRVLKMDPPMCTRRWYCLIPAEGEPVKLVHRIERVNLAALPGAERQYSSWREQREKLREMLAGTKRLAMQYSPMNDIPYVGLVDAGTVELIRSLGVEVVSSADLVQLFEARWSAEALALHLEAGKVVHAAIEAAFRTIRDAARARRAIGEYEVQQEIVRLFDAGGVESDDPPVVAVNANTANPHYSPTPQTSQPIREGDFVLLDVWAKRKARNAVYFDITWTGYVGEAVPDEYTRIFDIVREARDAAVELVQQAVRQGRQLRGYEVDEAARAVITRRGYGEYFIHRTGHSIGEDVHGNGANIDNFETRDDRTIIPRTCFSVEPGIYLPEFGVRTEVDVYVDEKDARVTGDVQKAVVPILTR
ncbi:MAG: aminopeptidase P family protein [Candidatus Eisenbacteria bacterium]|nr:aminopeptidase P family protein [Candidatus Eisenbacteria bacterium]